MSSDHPRLQSLLEKYLSSECTPEELAEFWRRVGDLAREDILTDTLRRLWDEKQLTGAASPDDRERIFRRILKRASRQGREGEGRGFKRLGRYAAAAAACAALLVAGWLLFGRDVPPAEGVPAVAAAKDVSPGGNRAVLTLAGGMRIDLDTAREGALTTLGRASVVKRGNGQLACLATAGSANTPVQAEMNRLSTPRGGQYKLVLSDGTQVWLNAESSISFPAAFGTGERHVAVTGEAYFEVAPAARRPFRVTVNGMEIEVLGTSFNVNAYADEPETRTTLLEGSVRLVTGAGGGRGEAVLLKPGQQARMTAAGKFQLVSRADTDESVGWKDGLFVFHQDDLSAVMRRIARWYDVSIVYRGYPEASSHVTGTISRNENLSQVLEMLSLAVGSGFDIEGRNVLVKPH